MARVPTAGQMTTSPKDPTVLKAEEEQKRKSVEQLTGAEAEVTYTIASGAIKPTVGMFAVDTEGGAGSDALDRITGEPDVTLAGFPGHGIVLLRAAHTDRTVVVTHEAGGSYDISLATGASFSLDTDRKGLALQLRGTRWYEIDRDYGEDLAARRSALGLTKLAQLVNPANPADDGRFVAASSGEPVWDDAIFGGDDFLATTLAHKITDQQIAEDTVVTFPVMDIGNPQTFSIHASSAPIGSSRARIQTVLRITSESVAAHAVRIRAESQIGGAYDGTGLSGARGLPSKTFIMSSLPTALQNPYFSFSSCMANANTSVRIRARSAQAFDAVVTYYVSMFSVQWS